MNPLIQKFLERGFLLNPFFLTKFEDLDFNSFFEKMKFVMQDKEKFLVLNEDIFDLIKEGKELKGVNWREFEKARVFFERNGNNGGYHDFLESFNPEKINSNFDEAEKAMEVINKIKKNSEDVIIIKSYNEDTKKIEVQDFVEHFKSRYNFLKKILVNRTELKEVISIGRLNNKNSKEKVSIIGLVYNKSFTKSGNIVLDLEDLTGKIRVVLKNEDKELFNITKDLVLDEVIGITGSINKDMIFAEKVIYPDIPNNELKKLNKEEYVVFTSDVHVGSKLFLENNFLKFIKWLNGESGNDKQKEIAKKVKYLFIVGDLVEGVGVYPGQFEDLQISDIYEQFRKFNEFLSLIRKDVNIILCGGNHDPLRIAEPQPVLDKEFCKELYEMENVTLVPNPCVVNIASSLDFSGFNILMYHGFSFPYYADNVESIKQGGRLERADLIMKYLLQKRHLAPTHTSIQYIPNSKEDPLLIDIIPDFFISGHIHRVSALNYKGVTLLNCGCWDIESEEQRKRGLVPDPCKVILVNLKKRDVKILNFNE